MVALGSSSYKLVLNAKPFQQGAVITRREAKALSGVMSSTAADVGRLDQSMIKVEKAYQEGRLSATSYAKAVAKANEATAASSQRQLAKDISTTTANLKQQLAIVGKDADAIKLYELRTKGASIAELQEVRSIQMQIQAKKQAIAETERAAKVQQAAMDRAKERQRRINDEVAKTVSGLKRQIDTFGKSANAIQIYDLRMKGATAAQIRQVQSQQQQLAWLQRSQQAADRASASMHRYATANMRAATALRKIGAMRIPLGGPLGMWLSGAGGIMATRSLVRTSEQFNQAMYSSLAIMGDVNSQMREDMETTARQVSYHTKFMAKEAAEAYYYLASAGLDAQQSLAAMPTVATFAQAGMFDLAIATDLLTDAQSALGLTVDDATQNLVNMNKVGDTLVKANTLANASVEQFSQALTTKAAAAMRMLGMDIAEGVAVLAAFADQGLKGSEAGTALSVVLRDLTTKAIRNEQAFKQHKIAVFDDGGELRNMSKIIADMERELDGLSDQAQKELLLELGFSDKSLAFTQAIIGTSAKIANYEKHLRDAGGTMQDVADKQMPPLTEALNKMRAEWETFADVVGGPVIQSLAGTSDEVSIVGSSLEFLTDSMHSFYLSTMTIGDASYKAWIKARMALLKYSDAVEIDKLMPRTFLATAEDVASDYAWYIKANEALADELEEKSPAERYAEEIEKIRKVREESDKLKEPLPGDSNQDTPDGIIDKTRATKDSIAAAREETEAVREYREELEEEIKTLGMSADAIRLRILEKEGATDRELESMRKLQEERIRQQSIIEARNERQRNDEADKERMRKAAIKALTDLQTPQEKYLEELKTIDLWRKIGAVTLEQENRLHAEAVERLQEEERALRGVREEQERLTASTVDDFDARMEARQFAMGQPEPFAPGPMGGLLNQDSFRQWLMTPAKGELNPFAPPLSTNRRDIGVPVGRQPLDASINPFTPPMFLGGPDMGTPINTPSQFSSPQFETDPVEYLNKHGTKKTDELKRSIDGLTNVIGELISNSISQGNIEHEEATIL